MNRSQVLVSVLLALFAAITGWMVYLRVEPPRPDRFTGPSRPDYELIDFELDAFDDTGKIAFRAKSPRLSHDDRRKAWAVTAPEFVLYGKNGQQWHATSLTAWIDTVAKRIDLERDVHVERRNAEAAASFLLTTESLVAFTETRRIDSDRDVEVTRPGSILRGRGLTADLTTQSFELKADVDATFAPVP